MTDPDIVRVRQQFGFMMLALRHAGFITSPGCTHPNAVPVESIVTRELLARLCPDCDMQLSTDQQISTEQPDEMHGLPRRITFDAPDEGMPPDLGARLWLSS